MANSDNAQPENHSRTISAKCNLIAYLRYAIEDVAAVNLASASLLRDAIAHLEDDEDNRKFGLRADSSSLS